MADVDVSAQWGTSDPASDSDSEEEFVYPTSTTATPASDPSPTSGTMIHGKQEGLAKEEQESDEEEFIYPSESQQRSTASELLMPAAEPELTRPTSAQGEEAEDPDDEERFVYSGKDAPAPSAAVTSSSVPANQPSTSAMAKEESGASSAVWDPDSQVPTSRSLNTTKPPADSSASPIVLASKAPAAPARPIDWSRLSQLCTVGDLPALQSFFRVTCSPPPAGAGVAYSTLANQGRQNGSTTGSAGAWASVAGGPPALHLAARAGKLQVVQWLVEDAGALPGLPDREGETPLHKAVLDGHTPVVRQLLNMGADADARDADGWTALHAAASLPSSHSSSVHDNATELMRILLDNGATHARATRGWTPLMTAASHGYTDRVQLLAQFNADPFVRNHAAETALDIAAANGHWSTAQYLGSLEQERWAATQLLARAGDALTPTHSDSLSTDTNTHPSDGPAGQSLAVGLGSYNPLALHNTVAVVLHENQRLDASLTTLALRGGKARWSHQSSARPGFPDRRAPGTMPPGPLAPSRTRSVPIWREDVSLPLRSDPYTLPLARFTQTQSNADGVKAHFWLGEWSVDVSHPRTASDGWSYATSFDDPPESWHATPSPPAQKLLEGKAWTDLALSLAGGSTHEGSDRFVRRRRWVRVLRRRLDISFGDALEAAEVLPSHDELEGPQSAATAVVEAAQSAARSAAEAYPTTAYVDRAKAIADASPNLPPQAGEAEHALARVTTVTLALEELRAHAFNDEDRTRQSEAETVLHGLTVRLAQARRDAQLDDPTEEPDEEDDEEEFIYPNSYKDDAASVYTRVVPRGAAPVRASDPAPATTTTTTRAEAKAQRAADLAASSEFLQTLSPLQTRPEPTTETSSRRATWQPDHTVSDCSLCDTKFSWRNRKHHCRACGKVVCASCSERRRVLPKHILVLAPGEELDASMVRSAQRVCDPCAQPAAALAWRQQ